MVRAALAFVVMTTACIAQADESRLSLGQIRVVEESSTGAAFITGAATNVSPQLIGSAFVTFNLYDSNDNVVGKTIANGKNIEPGQRWIVKAYTTIPFDHAKVTGIKIY